MKFTIGLIFVPLASSLLSFNSSLIGNNNNNNYNK